VRIAITANGPGEFAGWVRPLVAALRARDPSVELHVLSVPDDFASGREAAYAAELFPGLRAYPPSAYLRLALGRSVEGLPARVDRVQYLGGDLAHAARVHARLGGTLTTYKFSRKRYAGEVARVFAVDDANVAQLERWGTPRERIDVVGNLAIDGALGEASGAYGGDAGDDCAAGGIVIFPGSRKHEVANLFPFFLRVALELRRRLPGVPIAFAGSPFVADGTVRAALAAGPAHPLIYGERGDLRDGAIVARGERFPLVRAGMRAASRARLAISIPGTKLVELGALGVPAVVCMMLNAPELIVVPGVVQYVGKLPLIGAPLKRAAVVYGTARFGRVAQPNIDAGHEIEPELFGTLLPSHVARVAAERWSDAAWCASAGAELRALYAAHAGAADRMARALLEKAAAPPAAAPKAAVR